MNADTRLFAPVVLLRSKFAEMPFVLLIAQ